MIGLGLESAVKGLDDQNFGVEMGGTFTSGIFGLDDLASGFKLLGPGEGFLIIEIGFSCFNKGIGFRIEGNGGVGIFGGGVILLFDMTDIVEIRFGSRLDLRFGWSLIPLNENLFDSCLTV
jgi:hypothetical protein